MCTMAQNRQLRSELNGMKSGALRKRASGLGIGAEALEEADDANNTKAALIELMLEDHCKNQRHNEAGKEEKADNKKSEENVISDDPALPGNQHGAEVVRALSEEDLHGCWPESWTRKVGTMAATPVATAKVITGNMQMTSSTRGFANDTAGMAAQTEFANRLKDLLGVPLSYIKLVVTAENKVEVTITIPADATVKAADVASSLVSKTPAEVQTAVQAKWIGGSTFTVDSKAWNFRLTQKKLKAWTAALRLQFANERALQATDDDAVDPDLNVLIQTYGATTWNAGGRRR